MHHRSPAGVDSRHKNIHYDEDIHYTLQMSQWLLKLIGIWPFVYRRTTRLEQFVALIMMVICYSSLFFIILPSSHFVFFVDQTVVTAVKLLGPVGFCISSTVKYCYLGTKSGIFVRCIQQVERDWKLVEEPNYRNIMLKYVTISRRLITICAVFLFTGHMSYHTVMQFLSKEKRNHTFRPLVYPGYDAFLDVHSSPTYECVFFAHTFGAFIMYSISTAAFSLTSVFITHICGQIQIQILRLEDLVEGKRKADSGRDPLAFIVYNHVELLRISNMRIEHGVVATLREIDKWDLDKDKGKLLKLDRRDKFIERLKYLMSKDVEEAMREICLTEIVECTFNMCMLEYYSLMSWRSHNTVAIFTFITLLISFTFNIFIFCYISEILSEQCRQIGTASYEIKWYNLPAKDAYDLIMINTISQSPPKLTAGKIIELTLNTFSTVVKTSVVYFNLLRTLTEW